jgi:hypothetical protein
MIENTSTRDSMIHLMGAMSDDPSGYIEGMEAAGQRQLVNSDRLPTDAGDDRAYLALGFTFGPADPQDRLFRTATLPTGWRRQGSDHSMWSHIVDEFGRERVSIFYKAAFYDRSAHMSLTPVRGYVSKVVHGDVTEPVFDESWCTRAAFADALAEMRVEAADRVAQYEGSSAPWASEELPKCRERLAAVDVLIAKYPAVTA